MATDALLGYSAGLVVAAVTSPVGVSGAVFMLPIQLSALGVPNPSVTPTNLLYNVISGPGALWRFRRNGQLAGPLTRQLVAGTVPGVVLGAVIRVLLLPGPHAFRLVAGVVLLSLGVWLVRRTLRPTRAARPMSPSGLSMLALAVGTVGGVYGIGGGSILSPILVGSGLSVVVVAPAALASTFVTSAVGAIAYGILALFAHGSIAPEWSVGVASGLGGLTGGYLGAMLQPHVPEKTLRLLLGLLAAVVGSLYLIQGLR